MSVATFTKYLFKALAIPCVSVNFRTLSKILDGAVLSKRYSSSTMFLERENVLMRKRFQAFQDF